MKISFLNLGVDINDGLKFTIKDVAKIIDLGEVSARRYCAKFVGLCFGPGIHPGIEREIDVEECFEVFLGVNIIRGFRVNLIHAQELVGSRKPWLMIGGDISIRRGLVSSILKFDEAIKYFSEKINVLRR
jgi:hypothetical protein